MNAAPYGSLSGCVLKEDTFNITLIALSPANQDESVARSVRQW